MGGEGGNNIRQYRLGCRYDSGVRVGKRGGMLDNVIAVNTLGR